jgi:hypothetical protein
VKQFLIGQIVLKKVSEYYRLAIFNLQPSKEGLVSVKMGCQRISKAFKSSVVDLVILSKSYPLIPFSDKSSLVRRSF